MTSVPDVPPRPIKPIRTVSEYMAARLEVTSRCSIEEHSHVVDLERVLQEAGDVQVDHAFKVARTCPVCGAPGGGLTVRQAPPQNSSDRT